MTSITNSVSYNSEYNIPRVNVSSDVNQNRAISGKITLIPGADSPIEFNHSNKDGASLQLVGFTVKMVFWKNARFNTSASPETFSVQNQEIVLTKEATVSDPYSGKSFILLSHDDTYLLYQKSRECGLRWGLFLINEDKQLFPMIVNAAGGTFAEVVFDYNPMPSYEQIIGS